MRRYGIRNSVGNWFQFDLDHRIIIIIKIKALILRHIFTGLIGALQ